MMKKRNSTKRALVASLLALCMCFTMLVGTTFAWFTDSVTSAGNIIQSGTLKIDMFHKDGDTYVSLKNNSDHKVFDYANWEPGYTTVETLKIENQGSLALKYRLDAYINGGEKLGENGENLADVIDVYMCAGESTATSYADLANGSWVPMGTLSAVMAQADGITTGTLLPADENNDGYVTASFALHMREEAGNEYQGLSLGNIYLTLMATQWTYEEDSFNDQYDANAKYPVFGSVTVPVANSIGGRTNVEFMRPGTVDEKFLTASIPAEAIADGAEELKVIVEERLSVDPDVTVESDQGATTYEITVTGVKDGNTADIQVQLYIGEGRTGVVVYHKDQLVPAITYNESTNGYVWFNTTSFSPFTVVYDREPVEVVRPDTDVPVAEVTECLDYVYDEFINNTEEGGMWFIPITGSFADFNFGDVNENQKIEAAFKFTAPHNAETVEECKYATWECDFYVSLDEKLYGGELFLWGAYGGYSVGFTNPLDAPIEAGEDIPLLGAVTKTAWTYAGIAALEEFTCGVGVALDADGNRTDALDGKTFTVKLRLTNPEDSSDFIDVNVVKYVFAANGEKSDDIVYATYPDTLR